ncbi:signal peptidase II [Aquimarina pacifica]|uniref:signal peptidase II n=1 Tax=Aquimarina pacifica TaxID=1296415 RepID=UPI00046FC74C|nr:signal peptidase II [Aquimarina pacifica]
MKITRRIKIILILLLVLINISCDQISKKVVRETIKPNERIEIVEDNFILTKVENTGAAYSLGSNWSPTLKVIILQILPVLVLIILLWRILIKTDSSIEHVIGFTFIIGGGIGNLFDRILYGSVTDFLILDLGIIKTEIFNLADVSIMTGSILVLLSTLIQRKKTTPLKEA